MPDRDGVSRVVWTRNRFLQSKHEDDQESKTVEHVPFLAISRSLGTSWLFVICNS